MRRLRVIALLLALIMLFTCACGKNQKIDVKSDLTIRYPYGGEVDIASKEPITIPKLSEMEYVHFDTTNLLDSIEALTEKIPEYTDAGKLFEDYFKMYSEYREFVSMYALSNFRYSQDITDEYYTEEYSYCDMQYDVIEEEMMALYAAMAESSLREALETGYFYEGFFEDYDGYEDAGDEYFDLKERESNLELQYTAFTADGDLYDHYDDVVDLFIELVTIRNKIAKERGFDNYLDYAYKRDYLRDYTPAEAKVFLDNVKEYIVPVYKEAYYSDSFPSSDYFDLPEMLGTAAKAMGEPFEQAYRLLTEYELYDIKYGDNKQDTGYKWYIRKYEVPYIFINGADYDSFSHEFGHFVEGAYTYDAEADKDTAEIYSQAMEYLAIKYTSDISDRAKQEYICNAMGKVMHNIALGSAGASFEMQIYSLSPEELSKERIEKICMETYKSYGLDVYEERWMYTPHFFTYPAYYISYATSAVASLQICRAEYEEEGNGVELFCKLLDRTQGKHFLAVLTEAGIDNPFEEETLKKTGDFLKEYFGLEK